MAKIIVDTSHYEFAIGKKPKGFGVWIFQITPAANRWLTGSYSSVKKEISKEARRMGVNSVRLMP